MVHISHNPPSERQWLIDVQTRLITAKQRKHLDLVLETDPCTDDEEWVRHLTKSEQADIIITISGKRQGRIDVQAWIVLEPNSCFYRLLLVLRHEVVLIREDTI